MMTLIIISTGDEYSLIDHNVNLSVHQIMYLFFFSSNYCDSKHFIHLQL